MVSSISMPVVVDATSATKLAKALLDYRGKDVRIEAADVRRFSAFGLEVLIAASLQWRADGKVFEVANWSDEALEALHVLGNSPAEFAVEV